MNFFSSTHLFRGTRYSANAILLVALSSALAFSSCRKSSTPAPDIRLEKMQAKADSVRTALEARTGISCRGMHFYVQSPQGTYFISSAGSASEKLSSGHWLRFASVTKTFTSAAVLNMAEDGWVNIDDVITANIPGTNTPYVPTTSAWNIPYKSQITLRQLMSHTAGVFDADNDVVPSLGATYTDYMLNINPNHLFSTDQYTQAIVTNNLSYFPPGTGYHYSNTGYSMLSVIIGRVYSARTATTKTFSNYMTDVMLAAVPGTGTGIRFPDQPADNRIPAPGCNGFIFQGGSDTTTVLQYNPSIIIGEGNGQGTLKAVHDWIRTTYKGNGPLNAQTLQLLYTPLAPDYSNSKYTYGSQEFLEFGRGHTGARAGNLTLMSYDAGNDTSVFGYLPFWDVSDGGNTLMANGLVPLFEAASLLVDLAQ